MSPINAIPPKTPPTSDATRTGDLEAIPDVAAVAPEAIVLTAIEADVVFEASLVVLAESLEEECTSL